MKRITLTRKGFREWLEGKRPRQTAGRRADARSCPIARYLRFLGAKHPVVFEDAFALNTWTASSHRSMPAWATKVIERTDAGRESAPITARQALAVLDEKEAGA